MAAAAAISAVGSVAGGVASGKGAAKAAKISKEATDDQIAATQQYQAENVARYQPEVDAGNNALSLYDDAIGTGTDSNAASTALSAYQNSTGYKTTLNDDLAATNASAYASGLGRSGSALGALVDRANTDSQTNYSSWLNSLEEPIAVGSAADSALAGVSSTALASTNAATSSGATAAANAALSTGSTTSSVLNQLGQLGGTAYASSYGSTPNYGALLAASGSSPISVFNNPDYSEG